MKYTSSHRRRQSHSPKKIGRVRLPKDYPWIVAGRLLADLAGLMDETDVSRLDRVIRSRNLVAYQSLSNEWSLQSIAASSESVLPSYWAIRLQFGAMLKKFTFEGDLPSRREAAYTAMRDAEVQCSQFNRAGYKALFLDGGKPSRDLELMRSFTARVLGLFSESKVFRGVKHGPGATTSTSQGRNSAYHKYCQWPYHVTNAAHGYAKTLVSTDPRWLGALEHSYRERFGIPSWCILNWDSFWDNVFVEQNTNRLATVPKDAQRERPIAIEPTMNMMMQLGVDRYIRKRLVRWGITLNDQKPNQIMAMLGSVDESWYSPCTIDLSNASDTVSLRIAKLLLPTEWYDYVVAIRSPRGTHPAGGSMHYSKLSSMGNGATFAIESLIFAACCYAASVQTTGTYLRDAISVYGDDIVVPKGIFNRTCGLLEACGFSINTEKTFSQGPVRESCGCDWIRGYNVRPVYLKEMPLNIGDLYSHRNALNRWASLNFGIGLPNVDAKFKQWIPVDEMLIGPLSDEEFYGHWHTPDPGEYRNSMYSWRSYQTRATKLKGEEFLFRKLMATLKPSPPPNKWEVSKGSGGSVFDVVSSKRLRHSVGTRRASVWQAEYFPQFVMGAAGISPAGPRD